MSSENARQHIRRILEQVYSRELPFTDAQDQLLQKYPTLSADHLSEVLLDIKLAEMSPSQGLEVLSRELPQQVLVQRAAARGDQCAKCQSLRSKVVDSRKERTMLRRRRECCGCGFRWSTKEVRI